VSAPDQGWKRHADSLLGVAASVILLAMMFLTVVDVIARYVFSRPVRGSRARIESVPTPPTYHRASASRGGRW